jgi:hypothetical protein
VLLIALALIALGPAAIFVASTERRRVLRDRWTLAAFLALPLVWVALLAGMFALSPPVNGPLPRSNWPYLIILAALVGWTTSASGLIVRARGRRVAASVYALANAPGFFLVLLISGMIASGDWL